MKAQSDGSIILPESKIQIFDELTRGRIYVVMKKRSAIFLAGCLMLSLTACSSGENGELPSQVQKVTQAQEPAETRETVLPESAETEKGMSAVEEQTEEVPSGNSATENPSTKAEQETNGENKETEWKDESEVDFTYDYSEDIKADIDRVVSSSTSLQNELENVEKIFQKYDMLARKAQSQNEMNQASNWLFAVWDTELNNLWNRFSISAEQQTKEKILADQRNWIDMKEEAILETIGSSEENGSMYPMLVNAFLEEITRNRAYVLANELAKIKGESFVMPEKSKYGLFVDNQGTGSIYSTLITRQSESGDDEAYIGIYRLGVVEGTFVDNGNGELSFTSNDSDSRIVKGVIKINGWDGASFTVTEAPEGDIFSVGREFDFSFAF